MEICDTFFSKVKINNQVIPNSSQWKRIIDSERTIIFFLHFSLKVEPSGRLGCRNNLLMKNLIPANINLVSG